MLQVLHHGKMEQPVDSTLNQLLETSLLCGLDAEAIKESSRLKFGYMNLSIRFQSLSNF